MEKKEFPGLVLVLGDMVINIPKDKLFYSYVTHQYTLRLRDIGISSITVNYEKK